MISLNLIFPSASVESPSKRADFFSPIVLAEEEGMQAMQGEIHSLLNTYCKYIYLKRKATQPCAMLIKALELCSC